MSDPRKKIIVIPHHRIKQETPLHLCSFQSRLPYSRAQCQDVQFRWVRANALPNPGIRRMVLVE